MALSATFDQSNWTLRVLGTATSSTGQFRLTTTDAGLLLTDNDPAQTPIPITGYAGALPRHYDFSGVTNAGVFFNVDDDRLNRVTGTAGDDIILISFRTGLGNDSVNGGAGNDAIHGGAGENFLAGGVGDDGLFGHGGNDRLQGGRGNDRIDGGTGVDTMVMSGNMADYDIRLVNGAYEITHARGSRFDGVDLFGNVEFIQFHDQTLSVTPIPTRLQAVYTESDRTLTVSGEAAQAQTSPYWPEFIRIFSIGHGILVNDNVGAILPVVEIAGENGQPQNYNFSGLTNVGINLALEDDRQNRVIGSNFSDNGIVLAGGGNDVVSAGAGDDNVFV